VVFFTGLSALRTTVYEPLSRFVKTSRHADEQAAVGALQYIFICDAFCVFFSSSLFVLLPPFTSR
jgi:hypothetical protein